MQPTDEELVDRARRGDPAAMDTLLTQHEKRIYRFGLRMCGSEDAAKEVLQQTLITAFKSLHEFRGQAQLSTWLYQIARSFCSKSRRRRVDEPEAAESLEGAEALSIKSERESPEDLAQAKELGELLQVAILGLPESYREVLILRDVEGLTAEQAAEVLGIEVANLKSRLHRARSELRAHLSALLEPSGSAAECRELASELADFAAEDIDKAACERIEAHLAQCEKCSKACESLKRTVSLCRRIPGNAVPPQVRAAVRQALQGVAPGRS